MTAPFREIVYEFARRGYVTMAPSFRGHSGIEGDSQGVKEYAKGEVIDLLQAAQLVRKLPYVNSLRIAVVGFDHGASVALQAAARSNIFQAARRRLAGVVLRLARLLFRRHPPPARGFTCATTAAS